jgi:hypothetical protein
LLELEVLLPLESQTGTFRKDRLALNLRECHDVVTIGSGIELALYWEQQLIISG